MARGNTTIQVRWLTVALAAAVILIIVATTVWGQGGSVPGPQTSSLAPMSTEADIPYAACLPFVLLVLSHALLPSLPWTRWWYNQLHNRLLITAGLSLAVVLYYGLMYPHARDVVDRRIHLELLLDESLRTYLSFMVIMVTLFVISSDIGLRGTLPPYPLVNTLLLLVGTLLAGVIGNLAAAVLLIWVVVKTNQARKYVKHTLIFYIFLVGNIGGCLLASGDPALTLGYLWGRSWTYTWICAPAWLTVNGVLLVIYFLIETTLWRAEKEREVWLNPPREALTCRGWINLIWLAGALVALWLLPASRNQTAQGLSQAGVPPLARELVLLLLLALSRLTTPAVIRRELRPFYGVLLEIAVWFGGLFITMQIPLEMLRSHTEALPISAPWQLFWVCGALSSFLDNTAVFALMQGVLEQKHLADKAPWLAAMAQGVVFFGAMSYVGNGNNYLIKSIAQRAGIATPGFGEYLIYSMMILLPVWMGLTAAMRWMFDMWG